MNRVWQVSEEKPRKKEEVGSLCQGRARQRDCILSQPNEHEDRFKRIYRLLRVGNLFPLSVCAMIADLLACGLRRLGSQNSRLGQGPPRV